MHQPNSSISKEEREAIWKSFLQWQSTATDDQLQTLTHALECFQTAEVKTLVAAIREALADERMKRQLPVSLVEQLERLSLRR